MLSLLYDDGEILVLDKPAGLPSQPGEGVRVSVVEAVERDFGFHPFLVHRLDKETSGCLVVAKDARSASTWTRLIETKEMRKTYRAIVAGKPDGDQGSYNDPVSTKEGLKSAHTEWRNLGSFGPLPEEDTSQVFSYMELELGTGRMHQLRLHLASHGLPILGDDRHGDFRLNKELKKTAGLKRLCLVSWSLVLPGGTRVQAGLPQHFDSFFSRFPLSETPWRRGPDGD